MNGPRNSSWQDLPRTRTRARLQRGDLGLSPSPGSAKSRPDCDGSGHGGFAKEVLGLL